MFRDLKRLQRITRLIGKYGYDSFVRRSEDVRKEIAPSAFENPEGAASSSWPRARRFRMMLEELGPTFIKLGQVLSSRPDLIAAEYVMELRTLQDHCDPIPFREIEAAVSDALKCDPATKFSWIDPKPLATASIAQVHRGRTQDGEEVVIKVQRPGIQEEIRADIEILFRFARLLDAVIEEAALTEPVGIVREFDRAITEELNFQHEAANLREFSRLHEHRADIVIPRVFPELTTTRVLTMSHLAGVPFSRLPADVDKKGLAARIVNEAFDEVFIDGVFHADPHPGNILLLDDGRYGILDLGLLGRLTPQMKETLVVLALAIALRDAETVARTLYRLGQSDARVDIARVRDDTASVFDRYLDRSIKEIESVVLIQELLTLAMKHRIRIPSEYTMLARAAATIEGIVRALDPDIDIARISRPYAERLLVERAAPGIVEDGFYRALLQFQGLSQEIPLQLSQILADLSSGKFGVNVGGQELERMHNSLQTAATTVAVAILGGAFIIGAFIGLARVDWTLLGVPLVGVFGGAIATLLLSWTIAYIIFRPRLKKISIVRWLVKRRP